MWKSSPKEPINSVGWYLNPGPLGVGSQRPKPCQGYFKCFLFICKFFHDGALKKFNRYRLCSALWCVVLVDHINSHLSVGHKESMNVIECTSCFLTSNYSFDIWDGRTNTTKYCPHYVFTILAVSGCGVILIDVLVKSFMSGRAKGHGLIRFNENVLLGHIRITHPRPFLNICVGVNFMFISVCLVALATIVNTNSVTIW